MKVNFLIGIHPPYLQISLRGGHIKIVLCPVKNEDAPAGIRTRVTTLKGLRPWPLDDGGLIKLVYIALKSFLNLIFL